jgi:hypothetical protein
MTAEVLDAPLECRMTRDIDGDIARNDHDDVVILTMEACYRGAAGVRQCHRRLQETLGPAGYSFPVKRVEDRFAFIE